MNIRSISLWTVVLDQSAKYLVTSYCRLGESVPVIPRFLYLTYIQNPGFAFGFMANMSVWVRVPFFILITVVAGLMVYSLQRFLPSEKIGARLGLGLIWGGALGNFIDRIFHRKVVDFIDARYYDHTWYIFNVADSCITVGLAVLILSHWFESRKNRKEGF
jgi:signal peptidase II